MAIPIFTILSAFLGLTRPIKKVFTHKGRGQLKMDDENKVVDQVDEELPEGQEAEEIDETLGTDTDNHTMPDDRVPLRTHLDVKKALKDAKKRLAEMEKRAYDQDTLDYKAKVKERYVNAGYEEGLAGMLAEDLASLRERQAARREYDEDDILDDEIKDLSRTDEYFADAVQYSGEIKEKISAFKKKGVELSVEDAFALVSNNRRKTKEFKENSTQREIIRNKNNGNSQTNVPTASGNKPSGYKLDSDDRKALANLQRMQPDAGWTPEKYHKIMKQ